MPSTKSQRMRGRLIAIGDIHGCAKALAAVVKAIDLRPSDVLVPLGDYIDRGPDSRGVIDQLLALADVCKVAPLLGNHEIMLLEAMEKPWEAPMWFNCGGEATLASYGGHVEEIPLEHWRFFRQCRPYLETREHLFLHANYDPFLPLAEQPEYLLFWEHIAYNFPGPHESGKTAIVGHTPQSTGEVLDAGHLICIDTHCVGGGWLTALDVETGETWQADQQGNLRERR